MKPWETISSIFIARRELMHGMKEVVAGSGFTVQEADILVSLFGARELGWDDLNHDEEGFVAFGELERFLVHNPSLLSKRIRDLASPEKGPPLVEVAAASAPDLHRNAKQVRITDHGIMQIRGVWDRYCQMSDKLLDRIDPAKLAAHHEVNDQISRRIRSRRTGAILGKFS